MGRELSTMATMKATLGALLLCTAIQYSEASSVSCQDRAGTNGTRPNMCAKEAGSPFCINTAKLGEDPTFECRECDPERGGDCDCSPGKYCVKDKKMGEQGTCKVYERDILQRACSMPTPRKAAPASTAAVLSLLKKGFNDEMFCGKVVYDEAGNYKAHEWVGTCVQGKCQVCADFGAATIKYPNAQCGDRICVAGHFSEAVALNFSWEYFSHNPLIISSFFTFVVIFLTSTFGTVMACINMYKRMKKSRRKDAGGEGQMRA